MCARSSSERSERLVRLCGEQLPHPGHVCAFFDSEQQKYDTLIPFFIDAIREGDRVINIVDGASRTDHIAKLADGHVPVSDAIADDQLRVLTAEETYLRAGTEDLEHLLTMLQNFLETSERERRCIRTCGEMNWIGRSNMPIKRVLEYESRVNQFVPTFVCTLLCVYDLAHTPPSLMSDILATHPFAIIKGRLRANPYFVEPEEYLRMLQA